MESVKLRIREVLENKGRSIQWLSEQLGITYANTNNIVNGKSNPSLDRLNDISKILDVDIAELFSASKKDGTTGYIEYDGEIHKINSISDIEILLERIKGEKD